jgi:hypothetical protein
MSPYFLVVGIVLVMYLFARSLWVSNVKERWKRDSKQHYRAVISSGSSKVPSKFRGFSLEKYDDAMMGLLDLFIYFWIWDYCDIFENDDLLDFVYAENDYLEVDLSAAEEEVILQEEGEVTDDEENYNQEDVVDEEEMDLEENPVAAEVGVEEPNCGEQDARAETESVYEDTAPAPSPEPTPVYHAPAPDPEPVSNYGDSGGSDYGSSDSGCDSGGGDY